MTGETILDPYSFATVPVEMYFREQKLSIGTAFNWRTKEGQQFLITNWHNVTGVNPFTGDNLSKKTAARPDRIVAHFVRKGQIGEKIAATVLLRDAQEQPRWQVHPQWGKSVDVAAIPIADDEEKIDWFSINELENPDMELSYNVGQDVFILGYPFGFGSLGFPVWKRGSIASEPQLVLSNQQFMLVDSASRPGMSGSPVIRRSWGHHVFANGSTMSGPGTFSSLIGIYSGRLNTDDPLDAQLGLVWRTALISEVISGCVRDTF